MRRALTAVLLAGVAMTSACSRDDEPTPTTTLVVSVAPVGGYATLFELGADSAAVVVATAGPARADDVDGMPFTVTDVTVDTVLSGRVSEGSVLPVRQISGSNVVGGRSQTPPFVETGHQYLLFLAPSELALGEWVVVGPGQWARDGSASGTSAFVISVGDEYDGPLPRSLSLDDVRRALGT